MLNLSYFLYFHSGKEISQIDKPRNSNMLILLKGMKANMHTLIQKLKTEKSESGYFKRTRAQQRYRTEYYKYMVCKFIIL